MGARGPVGKRSSERVRRNKDEGGLPTVQVKTKSVVKPPAEDRAWHPIAKGWFRSLKTSGQSKFFEDSDWQAARLCADWLSQNLRHAAGGEDGPRPIRAAAMSQIWSMMNDLMTTEASRRRVRVELVREAGGRGDADGEVVVDMGDFRAAYG